MKTIKLLMMAVIFMTASAAYTQKVNRGDVCQEIPNLSSQQKSDIEKLSAKHQKKMDALRVSFYSERDAASAKELKLKMNAEQNSHYQAIQNLLRPEQKTWFSQSCIRYSGQGTGRGQGYGRGQGNVGGQGYGRSQGIRGGQGCGRGNRPAQAFGRGRGYNRATNL